MEIISTQIKNGEVKRADLNITTSGSSVIAKLLQGTGISLTSTGADAGTGDVTISATGSSITLSAIGTTPNLNAATITGSVLNLQPADASFGGIVTTGTQTFAGSKTFNSFTAFLVGFGTSSISTDASLFVNQANSNSYSATEVQLLGSTNIGARILERSSTNYLIAIGNSFSSHVIGSQTATEASSGTHNLIAQLAIKPLIITDGVGTTTNASTLYIEGAAIGTAVITNNYALWIAGGSFRFDGPLLPNNTAGTSGQVLTSGGAGVVPTWTTPVAGTGSGITRSIISIAVATTGAAAASVDYVYLANDTFTFTLPTAVGNTNRYTVKNIGTGTISIATTSAQTIDGGAAPITISRINNSLDFISNGTNWFLI